MLENFRPGCYLFQALRPISADEIKRVKAFLDGEGAGGVHFVVKVWADGSSGRPPRGGRAGGGGSRGGAGRAELGVPAYRSGQGAGYRRCVRVLQSCHPGCVGGAISWLPMQSAKPRRRRLAAGRVSQARSACS